MVIYKGLLVALLLVLLEIFSVFGEMETIPVSEGVFRVIRRPTYENHQDFEMSKRNDAISTLRYDTVAFLLRDYYETQFSDNHLVATGFLETRIGIQNYIQFEYTTRLVKNKSELRKPDLEKLTEILSNWIIEVFERRTSIGFHLLAYSTGVELALDIAHKVKSKSGGKWIIPRITALDPINGIKILGKTVTKNVTNHPAEFIDIIHSNAGNMGTEFALGHADFWPNGGIYQPGCSHNPKNLCSHQRATRYFVESLKKTGPKFCAFPSGEGKRVFMGMDCDTSARGSYYTTTNDKPPFAQGC